MVVRSEKQTVLEVLMGPTNTTQSWVSLLFIEVFTLNLVSFMFEWSRYVTCV